MAIVVLTVFVLSISFFVKGLSNADSEKLLGYLEPVFDKFNIDEDQLGEVAGKFVSRIGETKVLDADRSQDSTDPDAPEGDKEEQISHNEDDKLLTIALLSDTHNDFDNLREALASVKETSASEVFFLGDFTELGLIEDLEEAKKVMDESKIDYLAIPGDHDLWKTVGPENFNTVFKKNNHSITLNGIKFVLLDNSANYTLISEETINWFKTEIADADFVLLSQPLYHPELQVVMGVVNGEEEPAVKAQAVELLKLIRESDVQAIISGDQHRSDINSDPEKKELKHVVVGALTDERNLQTPRFSIMNVYLGDDFDIKDVVLE
ncbi:hypothetical protein A2415_02360 [candidate division WWE3 bacterium RIFOXYC1_FULL_39_7]|uniref:Calcineurin-like phosphoesterase domain-containing protein n=2 Tax=Katanobacteria TaxID=422282 RepID=A0A1F4X5T8_UNCKA|nr:MAG: hypothetical protein A2415_02360 [candidate division WWE3 bacterium RIFOXYC1_FULL_39_7]OGC77060.1 MAG: hypothetical protein A2619_01535 [candidate division WWE3 bacterium RIFOXYD1_FULL_39_9]